MGSDQEDFESYSRFTRRRQQRHLDSFLKPIWLAALCLISLSGWIAAFWGVLNEPWDALGGSSVPLSKISVPHIQDGEPATDTGAHNAPDEQFGKSPQDDTLAKGLSVDEILDGSWKPAPHTFRWAASGEEALLVDQSRPSAGEASFSIRRIVEAAHSDKPGSFTLETLDLSGDDTLLSSYTYQGQRVSPEDFWVDGSARYGLLLSNRTKEWRRSFRALYWLLDLNSTSSTVEPLDRDHPFEEAQLAVVSPDGDNVAFVRAGNIYLRRTRDAAIVPVTADIDPTTYNGIPGWGYEEEVLESNVALWWSPRGRYLAFLHTDESTVQTYTMSLYTSADRHQLYPQPRPVRYPKAGTPNPVVNLQIYDVDRGVPLTIDLPGQLPDDERIIFSVSWLSEQLLLVKQTNRESSVLVVFLIDLERTDMAAVEGELLRTESGSGDCWVEPIRKVVHFIPADPSRNISDDGYVDLVVHNGYNHLAYYTPLRTSKPTTMLTMGQWEVADAPTIFDRKHGWVYFLGTVPQHPDERHLYRTSLDGRYELASSEDTRPAYYDVSFAPGGAYALLEYKGPEAPRTSIIALGQDGPETVAAVESNKALALKTEEAVSVLPQRRYHYLHLGGSSPAPVLELLPPGFDPERRYPVIFSPYGGPGSQTVTRKFAVDFAALLASQGYVVVVVDGRGTGFNGRDARCVVRGRLGHFEALDQIAAGRVWKAKDYVDPSRLAIWGWSFGGYLTLKTLSMDAGQTFGYGMAVAPVTDWRLYDSLFTERHMGTPDHNTAGYDATVIANMTALRGLRRIFLAHGISDDNVHVQNTLRLVDRLVEAAADNYDMMLFPDSDHAIRFHGARKVLYQRMLDWLKSNMVLEP
ncbi:dipeptidyl aminopeptidase [Cordyceps javanica]|uniref:Probable dipeptidyl-aminopeptidase B n=1 Tax=Cordyceps javanica TaxID=43265 RepID=A0A545UNJ2_9HYPO|nr:dipeptidyl aminopeptidase [Cordyceps javanica]TQW02786.1 dipeptidyl aminopeptidase [Cordyceps javanica]